MLLTEISRLVPELVRLDDFEQSYESVNFVIKNVFTHLNVRTGISLLKLNQISIAWYQKFS